MQTIFEGEIKEYGADAYAESYHEAEIDRVDGFVDKLVGQLLETVAAIVAKYKFGFRTNVEGHSVGTLLEYVVTVVKRYLKTNNLGGDTRLLLRTCVGIPLNCREG